MKPERSVLDVVTAFIQRGMIEKSVDMLVNVAVIAESYEVDNLAVLDLTIDEYISALYPKPLPKVKGQWDRIIYGDAAFR